MEMRTIHDMEFALDTFNGKEFFCAYQHWWELFA